MSWITRRDGNKGKVCLLYDTKTAVNIKGIRMDMMEDDAVFGEVLPRSVLKIY